MNTVYLSLGSNIEPRLEYMKTGIKKIGTITKLLKISSVVETVSVGFESDTTFFNCVVAVETNLTPMQLLKSLKVIEKQLGRKSKSRKGVYTSRVIDIDIILFGRHILISDELIIPHPLYQKRSFVLLPLLEIAPDVIDPLTQSSVKEMCTDARITNMSNSILHVFSID